MSGLMRMWQGYKGNVRERAEQFRMLADASGVSFSHLKACANGKRSLSVGSACRVITQAKVQGRKIQLEDLVFVPKK